MNLMTIRQRLGIIGMTLATITFADRYATTMHAQAATTPPVVFDTKPAFMQVITNLTRVTNAVVITNYVVVTNAAYVTNLYNAAGQLLQPVPSAPPIPGLVPIPQLAQAQTPQPPVPAVAAPKPPAAAPDPAVVKATQIAAIKELLLTGLTTTSNMLAVPGGFGEGKRHSIPIPEGITSFDRKKGQALTIAMNTTAEKVVSEALGKVAEAVRRLNPSDPAGLLKGGKDAGTTALLAAEGQALTAHVLVSVVQAASETGLREAYRNVMLKGGGLLGAVLGSGPTVDIDSHVTKGVLDGIMKELAIQEATIRADPSARKTKTLQDAFKP